MKKRLGFTLVEVLVAVAMTAALVTAGLVVVVRMSDFWDRSAGQLTVESEARHVLDLLERDLTSIVWRRDGAVWFAAQLQPDQPTEGGHAGISGETWAASGSARVKPGAADGSLQFATDLAACRFGQAGVWLRFFATVRSTENQAAGPAAVSYQMVRRSDEGDTTPHYQLFRSEVPAETSFMTGYDLATGSPYCVGNAAPGAVGNVRRPPVDALLANNVLDFGLRLLVEAADGTAHVLFPTSEQVDFEPSGPDVLPSVAEIFLRIATPEGERRLRAFESGNSGSGDWWAIAEQHSSVFTRRVPLPKQVL